MVDNYESDFWAPVGQANRRYRNETYGRGSRERTSAGSVILAFVAVLSTILVIAGLIYATGMSARHKAALAASDCEPSLSMTGLPCISQRMEIRQYEGIVTPVIRQLITESAAYRANEKHNLVAAEAALMAEVATEQALDNSLSAVMFTRQNRATAVALITNATSFGNPVPSAAIIFTPQITAVADALVRAIQALAKVTADQARSSSLAQLRSFNGPVQVATAAAQTELKLLGKAVAVRPTASQEPCAPC